MDSTSTLQFPGRQGCGPAGWEELLRLPLTVIEAEDRRYAPRETMRDQIVGTPRLLLVVEGACEYFPEDAKLALERGEMLFVPALTRRKWQAGPEGLQLCFVSFESYPPVRGTAVVSRGRAGGARLELPAFRRIASAKRTGAAALAEGELKAILARFFSSASAEPVPVLQHGTDAHIRTAIRWIDQHFTDENPARGLHLKAGLSEWYFRKAFRRYAGVSPSEYVISVRMRSARFLLRHTSASVKEVAQECGYNDPLYFTRAYQRYWKKPPSADRR